MPTKKIDYEKVNWKYLLKTAYVIRLPELTNLSAAVDTFLYLSSDSLLTISNGYAWDGASGPTIDTDSFMRGSLVHDALYQLIASKRLSKDHRKAADKILYRLCREDGMPWFRAQYVYYAVRKFGASHV